MLQSLNVDRKKKLQTFCQVSTQRVAKFLWTNRSTVVASSCMILSKRNTYLQQSLSKQGVLIHWISLLYIEGSSNNKNSSCHATEDGVFHWIAKTNTNSSPIWHIFNIDTPQCWITYPICSANVPFCEYWSSFQCCETETQMKSREISMSQIQLSGRKRTHRNKCA